MTKKSKPMPHKPKWGQIYDNLYGFVKLTPTEEAIINSPYYQRLRWIKQLGFATYIFDGAEHTRFAHAIGALHMANLMIESIGRAVSPEKLFNPRAQDADTRFHRNVRVAALLHDIGTFPFSHAIEGAYIKVGKTLKGPSRGKPLPNNHEHLGSYLVKNTYFKGGLTQILERGGIDAQELSYYIKGHAPDVTANHILHSDLDADRLDYLVRDAHHTGLRYGFIDRDYLLHHLVATNRGLALKEQAMHAFVDFLLARYSWYSQVVRNASSAKFDVLAANIAHYLLSHGLIYSFQELLSISQNPEEFFTFNDVYFIGRVQELYLSKTIEDPKILSQMQMLLYRIAPTTIRIKETQQRVATPKQIEKYKRALLRVQKNIEDIFEAHGSGDEWVIADIPHKELTLVSTHQGDSILVQTRDNELLKLNNYQDNLLGSLMKTTTFIPNLYVNPSGMALLRSKKRLLKTTLLR